MDNQKNLDWRERLDRLHKRVAEELGGNPLPPPEDVIRQMREERGRQILEAVAPPGHKCPGYVKEAG